MICFLNDKRHIDSESQHKNHHRMKYIQVINLRFRRTSKFIYGFLTKFNDVEFLLILLFVAGTLLFIIFNFHSAKMSYYLTMNTNHWCPLKQLQNPNYRTKRKKKIKRYQCIYLLHHVSSNFFKKPGNINQEIKAKVSLLLEMIQGQSILNLIKNNISKLPFQ